MVKLAFYNLFLSSVVSTPNVEMTRTLVMNEYARIEYRLKWLVLLSNNMVKQQTTLISKLSILSIHNRQDYNVLVDKFLANTYLRTIGDLLNLQPRLT